MDHAGMTPFSIMLAELDRAAHDSAFGRNLLPTPSEAQCQAGNYRVGRVNIHGLPVSIEQPRDSVRCGTDASGKAWRSRMAAHYGYINGTTGADGDHVDCFIGDWPISNTVWVINQHIDGKFDEHKVMLLFNREDMARAAYLDSYEPGWNGIGSMIKLTPTQLSFWLKSGDMSKPLTSDQLFNEGFHPMNTTDPTWDSGAHVARAWYDVERLASGMDVHELHEPLAVCDAIAGGQLLPRFDALVVTMGKAEAKLATMQSVLARNGGKLSVVGMQITDPFKQAGTTNIVAIYELSDGQTISIYLHNPDTTPNKLAPTDAMVAWKWLLNRRDVSVVVAPENGQELSPLTIGRRVMALAEKNSDAFVKANARRAEKLQALDALVGEVADLTTRKRQLQNELAALDVEIVDAVAKKQTQARTERASRAVIQAQVGGGETQEQQGDGGGDGPTAAQQEPAVNAPAGDVQQPATGPAPENAVQPEQKQIDYSKMFDPMTIKEMNVVKHLHDSVLAAKHEGNDEAIIESDRILSLFVDTLTAQQFKSYDHDKAEGVLFAKLREVEQELGFGVPAVPATDQDPQAATDRALFQSIIDGTVPDLLSPEMASEFEAAGERREKDPDMKSLFEQAVNVYQEAMLAATANLA
jgi:hypothetical protein